MCITETGNEISFICKPIADQPSSSNITVSTAYMYEALRDRAAILCNIFRRCLVSVAELCIQFKHRSLEFSPYNTYLVSQSNAHLRNRFTFWNVMES